MRISNAGAIAACNALVDLLDAGAGAAYIEIRTGTQPATVETAATGTLLATLTCSDPAFGNAADENPGAKATANAIASDTSADATGVAGWFRAYDSNNVAIIDGTCGTTGTDMILDDDNITIGGVVACTSWTVTMPEA